MRRNVSDTVQLSGWLFADLLLGLMIIFFVSVPGKQDPPPIIPVLQVSPAILSPDKCTGSIGNMQCTVSLQEPATSVGDVSWTATSDISDKVVFNPASGTLSPGGKPATIIISSIACNNGSFTFSGAGTGANSGKAYPVAASWHCSPPPKPCNAIEQNSKSLTIVVPQPDALRNSDANQQAAVRQNIQNDKTLKSLQGRRAGFVLSFGGSIGSSPNNGNDVADSVNQLLRQALPDMFSGAAFRSYHDLSQSYGTVSVEIFLFTNQTCQ